MKEYKEQHSQGHLSIEKDIPKGLHKNCDIGIQISNDGKIWICIDGIAFIRFYPDNIQRRNK